MRHCFDEHAYTRWCIFRPTHIRHTLLLTCAKSDILHIRPTSTWFFSCYMDLWPQRPAP